MITANFNAKKMIKTINNIVDYSSEFLEESKRSKNKIAKGIADAGVEGFYLYLDGLARMHPGMLHHVYEWGQVGDPFGRLFELSVSIKGGAEVSAEFLQSSTTSTYSDEPFYDKAEIMEAGDTIIVSEKEAQALFFEVDGEEVFVKGPIVISNPGGEAVRGSFVNAFNDFYRSYFSEVYIKSINLYREIEQMRPYRSNIKVAAKSSGARNAGKNAAKQWVNNISQGDING